MYRIICCLALFFAAVVPSDAQPLADRVPGDAIVYIGWRGTADPGSGYAASRLKQVVDQSNISAAMNDFVPRALKRIGMINADAKEATDIIASFGGAMWKNPTAMYFAGVDFQNGGPGGGPMPRFGFVCQAGAAAKDVQAKLEQLLAKSAHPVPGLEVFQEGDLIHGNHALRFPWTASRRRLGDGGLLLVVATNGNQQESEAEGTEKPFHSLLSSVGSWWESAPVQHEF